MEIIEIADSSDDEVVEIEGPRLLKCFIRGQPVAMPRPRVFRNRLFRNMFVNLRKPQILEFQRKVKEAIPATRNGPVFPRRTPVQLKIWFLMSRPNVDFINQDRDRLKPAARSKTFSPKLNIDVDNLAKFVLDALTGLAYTDDAQVVKLECYKMQDNEDHCHGGTIIHFGRFDNNNPDGVLPPLYQYN
jgi:Holliday junction resolvase RusA-like endonuclease